MYREAQRIEADPAQVDNIESLMTAVPEVLQTAPDEVENQASPDSESSCSEAGTARERY